MSIDVDKMIEEQTRRNDERVIQAAARVLTRTALRLLQDDNHMWSARPCATCRAISEILAEPFGCVEYARRKR